MGLAVDMLADRILFETLQYSQVCEQACSEEVPEPLDMGGKGFSVAFDPLDGSSIVDTNFAVGTIFGAWPGADLKGITGRDQAAAGIIVYGPRTVFCLALKDFPGCHEFLLLDDGTWQHVKETTQINEGKMFSPGNLRATQDNPEYSKLVDFWLKEKYTLRYTGGMPRRFPDHREGERRILQRHLPHHRGQAPHPLRGRPPRPARREGRRGVLLRRPAALRA